MIEKARNKAELSEEKRIERGGVIFRVKSFDKATFHIPHIQTSQRLLFTISLAMIPGGCNGATPTFSFFQVMANQRMIAKAAGVTQAAVSLALRGDRSIPTATRQRIMDCAQKLGYRPNSYISALMAHVRAGRPPQDNGCIALVVNATSQKEWLGDPKGRFDPGVETFRLQYEGISNRAESLGFRCEAFFLQSPGMSAARLDNILDSRGIVGVVLMPPQGNPDPISLTWSRYAVATIAYGWRSPEMDRVTTHHRHNVHAAFAQLHERGYQKIGVCLPPEAIGGVDLNWQAGFLLERARRRFPSPIPQFVGKPGQCPIDKFKKWIDRNKPEALVTLVGHEMEWLDNLGLKCPEDIGLICVNRPLQSTLSGMEENHLVIGATVADLVVAQITRNEFGLPEHPKLILIEGSWVEGKTLRINRRERK